jgi:glycerophosphoryl diester phosphodiesterase
VKIYAHRGSSIQHPELTKVAYKAAIDEGADGFECDVRLTKDKQLVLWHDPDLQRITGNSARIADSNFADIKRLYPQVMNFRRAIGFGKRQQKRFSNRNQTPSSKWQRG